MRKQLNVQQISQSRDNDCWIAVCNMINLYYRGKVLFWNRQNEADKPGDVNTVAKLSGFRWKDISIDFSEIKNAINNKQILLADTKLKNEAGHAVLISGYDDTKKEICVLDPAIPGGNIEVWQSYKGCGWYTGASEFWIDGLFYAQYDYL